MYSIVRNSLILVFELGRQMPKLSQVMIVMIAKMSLKALLVDGDRRQLARCLLLGLRDGLRRDAARAPLSLRSDPRTKHDVRET